MGGEKLIAEGIQRATPGSPPRGRGKATFPSRRPAFRRITPAWAGKRLQHTVGNPTGQDHPRVGGEKHCPHGINMTFGGSPPRGRGKVVTSWIILHLIGITPAWAGKSGWARVHGGRSQDHPRVGGEKGVFHSVTSSLLGSPPRGRGKARPRCRRRLSAGITPAWAGKRTEILGLTGTAKDHPRVGGEKVASTSTATSSPGSPPRGRGKGCTGHHQGEQGGITPAWAGKRLKRSHRSGIFISGPIPFHSVLHRPAGSGGSRAGRDGSPAGQPQNTGPA